MKVRDLVAQLYCMMVEDTEVMEYEIFCTFDMDAGCTEVEDIKEIDKTEKKIILEGF